MGDFVTNLIKWRYRFIVFVFLVSSLHQLYRSLYPGNRQLQVVVGG